MKARLIIKRNSFSYYERIEDNQRGFVLRRKCGNNFQKCYREYNDWINVPNWTFDFANKLVRISEEEAKRKYPYCFE